MKLSQSGLPISLNHGKLILNKQLVSSPTQKRTIKEAKAYFKNAGSKGPTVLYVIHRGIAFKKDLKILNKNNLRYDITTISPGTIGSEFVRTIGHFHEISPKTKLGYPEIYEVLNGKALFLLQNKNNKVFLVKAISGQKVIVPPGFGHITINPTQNFLAVANIFSNTAKSIYDSYKNHKGGAYYVKKLNNNLTIEKNSLYKKVGKLKMATPKEIQKLKIDFKKPLYTSFIENPKNFDFLDNPQKFRNILITKNIFKF